MHWFQQHLTFKGRIILFLGAFLAVLLVQLNVNNYQSGVVLEQLDRQTGNFHSISQFSSGVERQLTALGNFRWENGDAAALAQTLRSAAGSCEAWLWRIDGELAEVGEEQYLLAQAVRTTYQNYAGQIDRLTALLEAGDTVEASALYYDDLAPCGRYLQQYTGELLKTAISEGQTTYSSLSALNDQLKAVQAVTTLLCLVLGALVVQAVWRLLDPVQQMIVASRDISRGAFDTPDVTVQRADEIGQLARAFNRMKHSMARQVNTLREKNEIERQLHRRETEALELQNTVERARLQHLRSQIDPHFLFNTLGVILRVSDEEQAPRTRALITALSQLLRYSLASNDLQVPLSREVRIIDEFFAIYHVRFGARVALTWRLGDDIDLTETLVPSFIVQPLVENAFKHGIIPQESGGTVRIVIRRLPRYGLLYIAVGDNGVGMDRAALHAVRDRLQEVPETGEHIGLCNVAARLRLLDPPGTLRLYAAPGKGTRAVLFLPLIEPGEEEHEDVQDPDC